MKNKWDAFCNWIVQWKPKIQSFLLGNRSWKYYAPNFISQKYLTYDTDDCWDFSALKTIGYKMNLLKSNGSLSEIFLAFTESNGYWDSDGLWAASERAISVLSGLENNGNDELKVVEIIKKYGLIPRSVFDFSTTKAQGDATYLDFVADYYNPANITPEMTQLGLLFNEYLSIEINQIGKTGITPTVAQLNSALQISPLQVSIPVNIATWNQSTVPSWSGQVGAQHDVALIQANADSSCLVDDQYQPEFKTLGAGYLLYEVLQYIVTPLQ